MESWEMSRFGVLLHGAATLQNLLPGWFDNSVAGSWKIDGESYFIMILSNRFSPRYKVTVEIPNLDPIPLWSLDISLRYKLLRERSRYRGDPKIYQECNISPPALSWSTDPCAGHNHLCLFWAGAGTGRAPRSSSLALDPGSTSEDQGTISTDCQCAALGWAQ